MAQLTITIDIDEEIGDISVSIDEIQANGIELTRNRFDEDRPPSQQQ